MKRSQASVHYRRGGKLKRCGHCTMFEAPNACSDVVGPIEAAGLCDIFDADKQAMAKVKRLAKAGHISDRAMER